MHTPWFIWIKRRRFSGECPSFQMSRSMFYGRNHGRSLRFHVLLLQAPATSLGIRNLHAPVFAREWIGGVLQLRLAKSDRFKGSAPQSKSLHEESLHHGGATLR